MRTYQLPAGSLTSGLRIVVCLALLAACATPAGAQKRKYFAELSAADVGVSVKNFTASVLYNVLLGSSSSAYLKLGGGSTRYGSDCPTVSKGPLDPPCGNSGAFAAGLGF